LILKPIEDNDRGKSWRRRRALAIGVMGILLGLVANGLTVSAALSLLAEPLGARLRPMAQEVTLMYGALVGLCGGVVAFLAVREEGTRWEGIVGLILAVSPLPLGVAFSMWFERVRQLVILP
jgi:hypothetical protein